MARNREYWHSHLRCVEVLEQRCYFSVSPDGGGLLSYYSSPEIALPDSLAAPDSLGSYDVAIRVQATDAEGNPLAQIHAGEDFVLRVYVQDTGSRGEGVFGSYVDISYDSNLVKATGPIQFAFPNGKAGDISPGHIEHAGAFAGLAIGDTSVRLLFSMPMKARHEGTVTFEVRSSPIYGWSTLLYGFDGPISPSRIDFQPTVLTIASASPDSQPALDDDPGYTSPPTLKTPEKKQIATPPIVVPQKPTSVIDESQVNVEPRTGSGTATDPTINQTESPFILSSIDDFFRSEERLRFRKLENIQRWLIDRPLGSTNPEARLLNLDASDTFLIAKFVGNENVHGFADSNAYVQYSHSMASRPLAGHPPVTLDTDAVFATLASGEAAEQIHFVVSPTQAAGTSPRGIVPQGSQASAESGSPDRDDSTGIAGSSKLPMEPLASIPAASARSTAKAVKKVAQSSIAETSLEAAL